MTTPAAKDNPCHCNAQKAEHSNTAKITSMASNWFCLTKNKGYHKYPTNSISKKKKAPRQALMQPPP